MFEGGIQARANGDSFSSLLQDIPIQALKSELARRIDSRAPGGQADGSTCGSDKAGYYNTPAHVFALFLILILSTLACSFPILARRFPGLPIPRHFLFFSRHFGTGVLIATAFVHLLPTAFNSLLNSCLPPFWTSGYPAMAGFIAMLSVFLVVTVEMFFASQGAAHVHGKDYDELIGGVSAKEGRKEHKQIGREEYIQLSNQDQAGESLIQSPTNSTGQSAASASNNEDLDMEELGSYVDDETTPNQRPNPRTKHARQGSTSITQLQNPQRQLLQCLLLEAGILFHSIFIGMALSVATGTSFIVLLVAISFHQTFEGFALGSRIASLIPSLFPPSSFKPWLMACAYGTTTPIGQAIGLVLHNMYDPRSATGLIMVGFTNAISSGLLLFAGLVELLAEDFLSEESYETLSGWRRVEACLAVLGGAMLMSIVGAFA
ncbi:ZIP family zinc transporter, putative [Talaromyces stipitatus ATCC 10500]|uniref:ZIP family zinc transporter, putative n=1 Tax=Talaromyces stipitatus (strain ATCC 10500 / CBS 375.48 / QM 6759 / NRRL 1006) TaxID=441959 RepID=B8MHM2_TALSN|nr:ZIP family zinc transporter, putative [Talaromyces stipitatus ATCC 10500]EED16003.1 ZIP family zinc transporter, putative [Talaromyces stipitatus ATCC 10500]